MLMLNHEQIQKLISLSDKESIISEVNKLSEDEAKTALVITLIYWHKNNEINDKIISDMINNQNK